MLGSRTLQDSSSTPSLAPRRQLPHPLGNRQQGGVDSANGRLVLPLLLRQTRLHTSHRGAALLAGHCHLLCHPVIQRCQPALQAAQARQRRGSLLATSRPYGGLRLRQKLLGQRRARGNQSGALGLRGLAPAAGKGAKGRAKHTQGGLGWT